jgi:hypothetical protein
MSEINEWSQNDRYRTSSVFTDSLRELSEKTNHKTPVLRSFPAPMLDTFHLFDKKIGLLKSCIKKEIEVAVLV